METKDAITDTMNWVDELLVKLEGNVGQVMSFQVGGQTISATIDAAALTFFKDNKPLLIRLGKDLFSSFLILLNEKKEEQAFDLLLSKMEADEIIARLRMDAAELQKMSDDHDSFMAALKTWALNTLSQALGKLLVGLLLPLIP